MPANQKAVDETIQLLLAGQMCLWPEEEDRNADTKATSPPVPALTPSVQLTLNSKQCSKQQLMVALDTFAQSEDCEVEIWYLMCSNETHCQHQQRILAEQQAQHRQQEMHWQRGAAPIGGSFDPFTGERLVAPVPPDYDAAGNPLKLSAIKEPEFEYYIELVIPVSIYLSPPADYPPRAILPHRPGVRHPMEKYESGSFGVPSSLRPATKHYAITASSSHKRQRHQGLASAQVTMATVV